MISVIVPTLNEEKLLPSCLESISNQQEEVEIIVTDGGSLDCTQRIARKYTDLIVQNDFPGLANQLNAGAAVASGNILLFLHADSRLSPGCLSHLLQLPPSVVGGAFTMQVEGERFFYRILSAGGNIYCRITGTYFGDRGIFVRADHFKKLGGFTPLPIMSDVDFTSRLKALGKTVLLPGPIITSSRKFTEEKPLRTLYLITCSLIAYYMKVDPEIIRRKYYSTNQ